MRLPALLVATWLLASGIAGCGSRVDRGAYVKANEQIFEQLPKFPGARLGGETSTAYRSSESRPIVGYSTRFDLTLPPSTTVAALAAFYRQRLPPRWRLVEKERR